MKTIWQKGWGALFVVILLFISWEASVRIFRVPNWLLPSPSQIVKEMVEGYHVYGEHLLPTLSLALSGLMVGCLIGIIIGIGLHIVPFLRQAFYPLLIISQNIPVIVLAPLLVIWFGFGMLPKMIVITLVCFFPITVSLLDGFQHTDRELWNYMKMAGATRKQLFWKLEWPQAIPALFSGLKISATYSVMGAVIPEWLGAERGIGVYMTLASSSFRTDRVFVAILFVVTFSLLLFAFIVFLEKLVIKWDPEKEGLIDE